MAGEYKSNLEKIVRSIDFKKKEVQRAVVTGIEQGLYSYQRQIIRGQLSGRPGLSIGAGNARRSWRVKIDRISDNDIVGRLGSTAKYLVAHQKGMTITGKRGWLAIPLSKKTQGRSPKDFGKDTLLPIKSKRGNLFLAQKKGKTARSGIELMFLLRRSVKIPKRLTILEDFKTSGRKILFMSVLRHVKKAMKEDKLNA